MLRQPGIRNPLTPPNYPLHPPCPRTSDSPFPPLPVPTIGHHRIERSTLVQAHLRVHDYLHVHVVVLLGVSNRVAQALHGELVHGNLDGLAGTPQQLLQGLQVQVVAVPGRAIGQLVVRLQVALRADVREQCQLDGVTPPPAATTLLDSHSVLCPDFHCKKSHGRSSARCNFGLRIATRGWEFTRGLFTGNALRNSRETRYTDGHGSWLQGVLL